MVTMFIPNTTIRTGRLSIALVVIVALVLVGATGTAVAQTGDDNTDFNVSFEHDTTVAPGGEMTILLESSQVSEWSVEGNVGGWTVEETDPSTLSTFPDADSTPYTSEDDDDIWGHVYGSTEADASFELTLTAPDEEGEYTFTGFAERDDANDTSETISIVVAEPESDLQISAFEDVSVIEGQTTEVPVELSNDGTATGNESVTLSVGDATSYDTEVSIEPNTTETVFFDAQVIETLSVGAHDIVVATADETASAKLTVRQAHESGAAQETYEAVDQDGDGLNRDELRHAVQQYVTTGQIGELELTRNEIRSLVSYYVQS